MTVDDITERIYRQKSRLRTELIEIPIDGERGKGEEQ